MKTSKTWKTWKFRLVLRHFQAFPGISCLSCVSRVSRFFRFFLVFFFFIGAAAEFGFLLVGGDAECRGPGLFAQRASSIGVLRAGSMAAKRREAKKTSRCFC